ncbi:hypothetical protein U8Q05_25865 [Rhizobium ruizarguesonis]|nr:hypothetical protein U8Q05_25865 [Rhizobium ruizarguesonis]
MTLDINKILQSIPASTSDKRKQMRANADGLISNGDDVQREAAQRLLDALAAQDMLDRNTLAEDLAKLTTGDRLVQAFKAVPMTKTEEKLIQVLLDHPNSTSSALTQALGWGAQSWHLHFGTMCANRASYLWPAPDSEHRDAKFYSGILADLTEPENTFSIKPDLVPALALLGLRARLRADENGSRASKIRS